MRHTIATGQSFLLISDNFLATSECLAFEQTNQSTRGVEGGVNKFMFTLAGSTFSNKHDELSGKSLIWRTAIYYLPHAKCIAYKGLLFSIKESCSSLAHFNECNIRLRYHDEEGDMVNIS